MASGEVRRYHLMLYAADHTKDLFTPIPGLNDESMIAQLGAYLKPLVDAFPAGELWSDDGRLLWRKGPLDA